MLMIQDFRRHIRPFFMTPDGQKPTLNKRYYDILSYVATQAAFCFTTAPFVLLTLPSSLLVWSRVYFYTIFGVAASMAFFASPAKPWLNKRLSERNHLTPQRSSSQSSINQPMLGLPSDPGQDIDEAVKEIREEVEVRRRKGLSASMPAGKDLKVAVENKLGKKL